MNFDKRASECADKLERIKDSAQEGTKSSSRLFSSTPDLLDGVITQIDNVQRNLQFWVKEARNGRQTSDESAVQLVEGLFEQLDQRIEIARRALTTRLNNRRRHGHGWRSSKRDEEERNLKSDLAKIEETIGRLQSYTKTIFDDENKLQLRRRINEVDRRQSTRQARFSKHILSLPEQDRTRIPLGSLILFWEQFPSPLDLSGRTGADPGDGIIFMQKDIEEAETVLRTFCEAWKGEVPKENPPWALDILLSMGRICLILNTMTERHLLDKFLTQAHTDHDLPLEQKDLEVFLPEQEAAFFFAEQYRAVRHEWPVGKHIVISDEEPLPLLHVSHYDGGSYSTVRKVKDPSTGTIYVLKQQKKSDDGSSREHFQNEITRLRDLHHPHIVQFVKSYERGSQYGMLLQPAANCDMWNLFRRWQDQPQARGWIEKMLMKSFGCLTHALVYVHKSMRHKDIKPQNILWLAKSANEDAQFLWADFGLAYDFSKASDSKTQNETRFSPRYAAPEFVKPLVDQKSRHMSIEHGRKSDIFSFGLVFLETLSLLRGEGILKPQPSSQNLSSSGPKRFQDFASAKSQFSDNILGIEAWIDRHLEALDDRADLRVLFKLGRRMIQQKPEDRPDIEDILDELCKFDSTFFCTKCLEAMAPERPKSPPRSLPSSSRIVRVPIAPLNPSLKRVRTHDEWPTRNELKPPLLDAGHRHSISSVLG